MNIINSTLSIKKELGMRNKQILSVMLLLIGFVVNSYAQHNLKFEINRVLPFVSIQESKLNTISTLSNINPRYPSSWIREFISVEVSAYKNGEQTRVLGVSDVLNQNQKELIRQADRNREIAVVVKYIPENTLKNNKEQLLEFNVSIIPTSKATFGDDDAQLMQYFKDNYISKIDPSSFTGYDLTAIKFTVTEHGQISDLQVSMPSRDPKTDEMLVAAIKSMQGWKAAEFSNGVKVSQSFVLMIGNIDNCMANLLNAQQSE